MPLFKINKCKIWLLTSVVQRGPQRMKCSPQFKLFIFFSAADVDFEFKQVNNTFQVFRIFPNQGFQYRTSPYKRRRAEWTENTLPAKMTLVRKQQFFDIAFKKNKIRVFRFSVEKPYCYTDVSYHFYSEQSFVSEFLKTERHITTNMQKSYITFK